MDRLIKICFVLSSGLIIVGLVLHMLRQEGSFTGVESSFVDSVEAKSDDDYINICSQHPALCPVDEANWTGEPDGWRITGKKWIRDVNTPDGVDVVWEFSLPYTGTNTAYLGERDNPYKDYSNRPDDWPLIPGYDPKTYDWEMWMEEEDNFRMYRYGAATEVNSAYVGRGNDCYSGTYYPVTNELTDYSYSPMSVLRNGVCAEGGYISAEQIERWGAPRSEKRVALCDSPLIGIPLVQSRKGNAMCKLSPYVGVVVQRYAWAGGAPPSDYVVVGCEAAVYAWGWPEYEVVDASGQDYQAWFRNGELRLTKWLNLSGETSTIPDPADDVWWNARCERAWNQISNWLYTGVYRVGTGIYTDTIDLPYHTQAEIPVSGGDLFARIDNTMVMFPNGAFSETAYVTHTIVLPSELPETNLPSISIYHAFEITAVSQTTHQPINPAQLYTITVQYSDVEKGVAIEDSLAFYYWSGNQWQRMIASIVNTETNTISITTENIGIWIILGEAKQTYVPLVIK